MADEDLSPLASGDIIPTEAPNIVPADDPAPETAPEPAPQPEAAAEQQQETEDKPKKGWEQRRIDELTRKRHESERRALEAERQLAEIRERQNKAGETQPEQAPDREAIRAQVRAELEAEQTGRAFAEATANVVQKGMDAFPDFEQVRANAVTLFGEELSQRRDFFEAITDLPNGHEVFYEIARDPERMDAILRLPPIKMAMEIANQAAKPKAAKPISKVPAPVVPVGGEISSSDRLDDESMPMDQWSAKFLKGLKKKGILA